MNTHSEIIKKLLKAAQTNNDGKEVKRLTKYIDNMHFKCLCKSVELCTSPCMLQKT